MVEIAAEDAAAKFAVNAMPGRWLQHETTDNSIVSVLLRGRGSRAYVLHT